MIRRIKPTYILRKVDEKNRIQIPSTIREELGYNNITTYEFFIDNYRNIVLVPLDENMKRITEKEAKNDYN